jgi:hypothetical protein
VPRYSVGIGPVRVYGGRARPMTRGKAVLMCLIVGPLALGTGVGVIRSAVTAAPAEIGTANPTLLFVVGAGIALFGVALLAVLVTAIVAGFRR